MLFPRPLRSLLVLLSRVLVFELILLHRLEVDTESDLFSRIQQHSFDFHTELGNLTQSWFDAVGPGNDKLDGALTRIQSMLFYSQFSSHVVDFSRQLVRLEVDLSDLILEVIFVALEFRDDVVIFLAQATKFL